MFTALAGLVSAITGLIVAVEQLRPARHQSAAATAASVANASSPTTNNSGGGTGTGSSSLAFRASATQAGFPAGRHVEANGGLRYDILSAHVSAGNPGQVTLSLRIRVTNPGRFPSNFWNATFRLRVGADTRSPTGFLDDVVNGGTTDIGEIDFTLAAATRIASLLVGDDPGRAIALPIRLTGRN
jgi:hypothetical protein